MSMYMRDARDYLTQNTENCWGKRTGLEQKLIILVSFLLVTSIALSITVIVLNSKLPSKSSNSAPSGSSEPPTSKPTTPPTSEPTTPQSSNSTADNDTIATEHESSTEAVSSNSETEPQIITTTEIGNKAQEDSSENKADTKPSNYVN